MIRRTTVLAGTFALVCVAHVAAAQTTSRPRTGVVVPAPTNPPVQPTGAVVGVPRARITQDRTKPRIAGIAAAVQPVPAQNSPATAGWATTNILPQVAAFYYLPAVVLTDGRVFANFNGNYEQVLRRCPVTSGTLPPGFATPACWMIDSNGRYLVVQQR